MNDLREYSLDIIKANPELGDEIDDLFSMMMEEIDDGSSEELESERFVTSVEELLFSHTSPQVYAQVPKWSNGSDCKSVKPSVRI